MKALRLLIVFTCMTLVFAAARQKQEGYIVQREKDIEQKQPGPHDGGGSTTAYPFFADIKDFKLAFRKRVLHPGSSIGNHLQDRDEVYYILSGKGEMTMNGKKFSVSAGDAILTRTGSSHGLKPDEGTDLTVLITYDLK